MSSLKYLLLCPFVFLCLSSTFANKLLNSNYGHGSGPDIGFGPRAGPGVEGDAINIGAGPKAGPWAGPGGKGVSNFGAGPKAGPGGVSHVGGGPRAGPGIEGRVSSVGAGPEIERGVSVGAGPRAGPGARRGVDPIVNGVGVGIGVGYRPGFGPGWNGPGIGGGLYGDCILGYVCPANERRECNKFAYESCESFNFHPLTASMDLHEVEINWAKSKPVAMAQHGKSELHTSPPTKKAQHGV